MVRSYRGREVDMNKLAKEYEKTIALGNGHMNGRGDKVANGQVVKTREEILAETKPAKQMGSVNLKSDTSTSIEKEIKDIEEEYNPATPKKKPVYTDITESEIKELDGLKEE